MNGHTTSAHFGQGDTSSTVASKLATAITNDSGAFVNATASGAVVTLTARTGGSGTNYSLSASSQNNDDEDFPAPSFRPQVSGSTLTGGTDAVYGWIYDSGTMTITVNGHGTSVSWGQNDTNSGVASRLVAAIQGDSGAYVTASLSGSRVNLTSKATGQGTNYPLSVSKTWNTGYFGSSSFIPTPSGGALTGGADQRVVYDSGTVSLTVNGKTKTASYGQGSSTSSIASDLANQFNADWTSPVTAQANGASIVLTSVQPGSGGNYAFSTTSTTNDPGHFSNASFSGNSGTMSGGGTGGYNMVAVYRVGMTYYPNGSVSTSRVADEKDPVFDSWSYAYDEFNRLWTANGPTGQYSYSYDRYGNRWHQTVTGGSGFTYDQTFNVANQSGNATYDAAGDVSSFNDPVSGMKYYAYDAENRLVSVSGATTASYAYDALGRRVKRTVGGTTYNEFYDADGHLTTERNIDSPSPQRIEIFGGGRHVVTYTGSADNKTYFPHTDWLGSEHARSDPGGLVCESSTTLPFGDHLANLGTCDPSPNHFTGKPRDTETNLDYFGARYYSSMMGRFVTADWSATPTAVPYAQLTAPQSLNLYGYVQGNPATDVDAEGHFLSAAAAAGIRQDAWMIAAGCFDPEICSSNTQKETHQAQNQANENTPIGNTTVGDLAKTMTHEDWQPEHSQEW